MRVGDKYFVDSGSGELFKGLGRPWAGLHTIDTIRRDGAEQYIWFETNYTKGDAKAEVVLRGENIELIYTIDMLRDVVERIEFKGATSGELIFSYLQDVDGLEKRFVKPSVKDSHAQNNKGILWLMELDGK